MSSEEQRPMVERLARLVAAQNRLEEIEAKYKSDKMVARAEIQAAARGLSEIERVSDRVEAVAWACENTVASKNDLAWSIFKKENQEYHLRKLLAGSVRACQKCGREVPAGYKFEYSYFYCDNCSAQIEAKSQINRQKAAQEVQMERAAREQRISELKRHVPLSDEDANELAALIVLREDGPESQLFDFVDKSLSR